jgi:ribose transport system permease protein
MTRLRPSLTELRRSSSFSAAVVLIALLAANAALQRNFFLPAVLRSNACTFVPLALVAMAQAVVVVSGSIDLSIGAALTLMNVVMASVMGEDPASIVAAMAAALAVGIAAGLLNGFVSAKLRLPPIVATFATGSVFSGASLLIMPQPGGTVPKAFYSAYQSDLAGILPLPLVVLGAAALFWLAIVRRPLGRHIYAVGGNEASAFASGVGTVRVKIAAHAIAGVFCALAAWIVTAQSASGDPNIGQSFTLPSVAVVVIGGIALSGGRGKLLGAVFGACIFGFLTNVIYFAKVSSFYQDLIRGVIIIAALMLSLAPGLRPKARAIGAERS